MNPHLDRLHTYPFEKLAQLKAGITPPSSRSHIAMSIGEPQHAPPDFILQILRESAGRLASYPPTIGSLELRTAAAAWLARRFGLPPDSVDPVSMVLPVNGTREALFSFIQAAIDPRERPLVAMPNPFYQIYEGAALLAGAEPYLIDTTAATDYVPDLDALPPAVLERCQVLILCSPGNPTGAVLSQALLERALALAERYGFLVAADECYADIYLDEQAPPSSLLGAAIASGRGRFERCIVFHSLSKRSSVPGLRSGFVAGDPAVMRRFLLYRTYHGSAMSPMIQPASSAAWSDDAHAAANRRLYQEKFARVLPILRTVMTVERPAGAFYLWPHVGADDERFARELFAAENVTVLPGSYLARASGAGNPGAGRVRISLTPGIEECVEAAERIARFMRGS
jgi:N-succinyldiaminopimelate aminotransferase